MIDTISISLHADGILIPNLTSVRTMQSQWGESHKGNFHNLLISKRNDSVNIVGSIQRFYTGNNTTNLNFDEDCKAIIHLCNTFSFEPNEARLKRIDFGANINTSFSPTTYFPFLGNCKNYYRTPYRNSLNYTNSLRTLSVYDKGKESHLQGNLLRFEARDFRPDKSLKRIIALADMLTPEVYQFFFDRWKREYNRIEKIQEILPLKNMNTKHFTDHLAAYALQSLGRENVRAVIKTAQKKGEINKKQAYRFREKLESLSQNKGITTPNELINELNEKILNYEGYTQK